MREGILRLLDHQDDVDVVGSCDDLPATARGRRGAPPRCRADRHPHAADGDRRGHPGGGRRSARRHPELGVVVLSQYVEPAYALDLFARGSERRAYLLKERVSEPEQARSAPIREVASGGSVVDPKVVESLVERPARHGSSPLDRLTPARWRCSSEIAQGKNNAAVASVARAQRPCRREAHQLALLQARPQRGARRLPARSRRSCSTCRTASRGLAPPAGVLLAPWERANVVEELVKRVLGCSCRRDPAPACDLGGIRSKSAFWAGIVSESETIPPRYGSRPDRSVSVLQNRPERARSEGQNHVTPA